MESRWTRTVLLSSIFMLMWAALSNRSLLLKTERRGPESLGPTSTWLLILAKMETLRKLSSHPTCNGEDKTTD